MKNYIDDLFLWNISFSFFKEIFLFVAFYASSMEGKGKQ